MVEYWERTRQVIISLIASLGAIFLPIEAYEVFTDRNVTLTPSAFLFLALAPGAGLFLVDGFFVSGFLRRSISLKLPAANSCLTIKFGDLFEEYGWKVISVNDFFDHIVDDKIISSRSLHGIVLKKYWSNDVADWKKQISFSLKRVESKSEVRSRGNRLRYPIGTAAPAETGGMKFIFTALGHTKIEDNVTTARIGDVLTAARGALNTGRAACSMQPLVFPLLGSGLARVNTSPNVLLDLTIAAIFEDSRISRVTSEIVVVLPKHLASSVNLQVHKRYWKNGQ